MPGDEPSLSTDRAVANQDGDQGTFSAESNSKNKPAPSEEDVPIKQEPEDTKETYEGDIHSIPKSNIPIKSEDEDEPAIKHEKEEDDDADDGVLSEALEDMLDDEVKGEPEADNVRELEKRHMSPEEDRMQYEKEAAAKAEKAEIIRRACDDVDRDELRVHARSEYGLVDDEIRQVAWPLLLGYSSTYTDKLSPPWRDLPPHADEEQVRLDVNRSFVYYPPNPTKQELQTYRSELYELIAAVLRKHPCLCYFQGFHDISQVILLVLRPKLAVTALEHISLLRIRDYMLPSLQPALAHLTLLHPIIELSDSKLSQHLSATQPFFALAAMLTLYAHDITTYSDAARLFDVFLAEEPIFPIYFFAVIVLERKEELFKIPEEEPEMLHHVLSKLPKPLRLELYISKAIELRERYPPESLGGPWRDVSKYSVLKTCHQVDEDEEEEKESDEDVRASLELGETYFRLQSRELDRQKLKKDILERLYRLSEHKIMIGWTVAAGVGAVALGLYLNGGKGGHHLQYDALGRKIWEGLGGGSAIAW